jgi:protein-S-isoprenylcysteine O-methyltransferase Ste14
VTDRAVGWAFVGAQAALLVTLAILPSADHYPVPDGLRVAMDVMFWCGVAVAVVAGGFLGRALTATPVPNAHATLRTTGPYRFVRHPIYTGVVIIVVAMATRSGNAVSVLVAGVTIGFFHWKASWEERRLRDRFEGYARYAASTPRFLPRLRSRSR